jgi:hypothetical protein
MSLEERLMGRKKYSRKFKEEAVRQVIDRGHALKAEPVNDFETGPGTNLV